MMKRGFCLLALLLLTAIFLSGCLPGDGTNTSEKPAGFFWGVWHGLVAPISFVVSLFKEDVRIYEVANTGWQYDLGFIMAIGGSSGGTVHYNKKKK